MFGRQKISSAVDNLDKFFDITDRSLIVFEEGVKNYIYHNSDALGGNLQGITSLNNEADLLGRDIEAALYSLSGVSRMRGDILRLLVKMERIVGALESTLSKMDVERPEIPVELNADFIKLMEFSAQAISASLLASRAYFKSSDLTPDKVRRVTSCQKEASRQANTLLRRIYTELPSLSLAEKNHLRHFVAKLEDIAFAATKLADQLSVMTLRRSG